MPTAGESTAAHVALLPSAGMGHLTPFCRLAAALSSCGCHVSFIAVQPTVSSAESLHLSALFASHPNIHPLPLHLPLASPSTPGDPFFLRFESIRRSAHLLPPLLATASPPVSALIIDISVASAFLPSHLPTHILFTSSAGMLAFIASYTGFNIPNLPPIPKSSIPPDLHEPTHLFTTQFITNGRALPLAGCILVNTFQAMEPEAIAALTTATELPKMIPIGPLLPLESQSQAVIPRWLDEQPENSVVYVSFGSRTVMSREQMRELGSGLERSGWRFLWVVKSSVVDRDEEVGIDEMLGDGFFGRVEGRGLVVKGWVDQGAVLAHAAVGGFVSHCGWNSVTEAAVNGVRVLAWPRGGDQRVTAGAVRGSGMGIWVEEWGWEAEGRLVGGEEIGTRVRELMGDEGVGKGAARVAEEAARAVADGGSSDEGVVEFISTLNNKGVSEVAGYAPFLLELQDSVM